MKKIYFKMPVRTSRKWYNLWWKTFFSKQIAEKATIEANLILNNLYKNEK